MDSLTSQPLSGTTPLRCGAQWDSGIHQSKTHLFWKADNWIEDAQKTRWSQFCSTDEFHRDHSKFGRRRTGSSTDHEWSSTPLVLLVSCLLLSSFVCLHRSFGGGSLRLIMEDSLEDIKVQVKLGLIALLFGWVFICEFFGRNIFCDQKVNSSSSEFLLGYNSICIIYLYHIDLHSSQPLGGTSQPRCATKCNNFSSLR